jgi:hypothetical protein
MEKRIHIALDFDKTLATYDSKDGIWKLGEPIKPMVEKVKEWLSKGYRISIFTARMAHSAATQKMQERLIHEWLVNNGLPKLDVTAIKHPDFSHFIDDKAYHVEPNTGRISDSLNI